MSLHASRSELKALRAQINPHFLFNALNSIAGLIHRDPAVADRTIEQLADVFRYALRGAESEWALLDDELDFVRAYLEVERARFGERLHVEVEIEEAARGARVPTMIVQTLVENAVKHGAASVRGPASVIVRARRGVRTARRVGHGQRAGLQRARIRPGRRARAAATASSTSGSASKATSHRTAALTVDRDDERADDDRVGLAAAPPPGAASAAGRGAGPMIRALIVDDEAPARDRLRRLLSDGGRRDCRRGRRRRSKRSRASTR